MPEHQGSSPSSLLMASGDNNKMEAATENSMLMVVDEPDHVGMEHEEDENEDEAIKVDVVHGGSDLEDHHHHHHRVHHIHNLAGLLDHNNSMNSEAYSSKSPSPPALETTNAGPPQTASLASSESIEASIPAASRVN